jgi:hypothetical protein
MMRPPKRPSIFVVAASTATRLSHPAGEGRPLTRAKLSATSVGFMSERISVLVLFDSTNCERATRHAREGRGLSVPNRDLTPLPVREGLRLMEVLRRNRGSLACTAGVLFHQLHRCILAEGPATGTIVVSCKFATVRSELIVLLVSVYSSGSAPPTSFNSPNVSPFPLSREDSGSPPNMGNGGIRLPNAPLTDIASMGTPSSVTQSPLHGSPAPLPHTPNLPGHALSGVGSPQGQQPRKSHTAPEVFFPNSQQQEEFFLRRNSVGHQSQQGSPAVQQQDLLASPAPMPSTLS